MADGQVVILINTDADGAIKDIDNVRKQIEGLDEGSKKAGRGIKDVFIGMGLAKVAGFAINQLANSLGSAIKRVDTLENSNRVFENMGYTAEETSDMMKQLDKDITGLPTAMDSAVKSVQLLASSTGDLGKSEKIFSALNNGILGFGGSAEDVNNAVLQLSQAFANGKIDAQTWNSMLNSQLGPSLKAIAKEMGLTMGELKSGLSDGSISVEEFQDRLINLNEKGGGGMKSLKQIAQDATGGISTSMTNMRTAVTRGVGDIIKAFNDWAKDNKLPTISQSIGIATDMIKQSFSALVKYIPIVLDWIKQLVQWISKNRDWLMILGSAIVTFMGVFKLLTFVTKVIGWFSALGGVWGAITTGAGLLGTAIAGLNWPFILIAGLIAGLIALGVWLWQNWDMVKVKAMELWNTLTVAWTNIWTATSTWWNQVWSTISTVWNNIWTTITTFLSQIWNNIVMTWNQIWTTISTILGQIWSNISSKWNEIKATTVSIWNQIVAQIKIVWNNIVSTVINKINEAKTNISNISEEIKSIITRIWNSFKGVVENAFNDVVGAVESGMQNAYNTVKSWFNTFKNAGSNLVGMIADGIMAGIDKVSGAINHVTSMARDFLPFSPAKRGALRDLDKLNFGGTISTGIYDGEKDVRQAMGDILSLPNVSDFAPQVGVSLADGVVGNRTENNNNNSNTYVLNYNHNGSGGVDRETMQQIFKEFSWIINNDGKGV